MAVPASLRRDLKRIRYWTALFLLVAVIGFALDAAWGIFFHGFKLKVGGLAINSATVEFPVLASLGSLLLLLVVQSKVKEVLLFCGSIVVGCAMAEGLLRVIEHPWAKPVLKMWIAPSDLLGWRLPSNFEGRGIFIEYIKTNRQGLRDVNHPWDMPIRTQAGIF